MPGLARALRILQKEIVEGDKMTCSRQEAQGVPACRLQ